MPTGGCTHGRPAATSATTVGKDTSRRVSGQGGECQSVIWTGSAVPWGQGTRSIGNVAAGRTGRRLSQGVAEYA